MLKIKSKKYMEDKIEEINQKIGKKKQKLREKRNLEDWFRKFSV